jgi:threonine/homoserine/homoserine lactone efflux protein
MAGLAGIVVVAIGMALLGKLTPEMADILKWVGGSFLGMRAVANVAESIKKP